MSLNPFADMCSSGAKYMKVRELLSEGKPRTDIVKITGITLEELDAIELGKSGIVSDNNADDVALFDCFKLRISSIIQLLFLLAGIPKLLACCCKSLRLKNSKSFLLKFITFIFSHTPCIPTCVSNHCPAGRAASISNPPYFQKHKPRFRKKFTRFTLVS